MKKTTAKTRKHKCGKKSHLHRNYKCTRRTSIKNLINDLKISRVKYSWTFKRDIAPCDCYSNFKQLYSLINEKPHLYKDLAWISSSPGDKKNILCLAVYEYCKVADGSVPSLRPTCPGGKYNIICILDHTNSQYYNIPSKYQLLKHNLIATKTTYGGLRLKTVGDIIKYRPLGKKKIAKAGTVPTANRKIISMFKPMRATNTGEIRIGDAQINFLLKFSNLKRVATATLKTGETVLLVESKII